MTTELGATALKKQPADSEALAAVEQENHVWAVGNFGRRKAGSQAVASVFVVTAITGGKLTVQYPTQDENWQFGTDPGFSRTYEADNCIYVSSEDRQALIEQSRRLTQEIIEEQRMQASD